VSFYQQIDSPKALTHKICKGLLGRLDSLDLRPGGSQTWRLLIWGSQASFETERQPAPPRPRITWYSQSRSSPQVVIRDCALWSTTRTAKFAGGMAAAAAAAAALVPVASSLECMPAAD
jgi:hypothetical protein